jgi:hypothetical protein
MRTLTDLANHLLEKFEIAKARRRQKKFDKWFATSWLGRKLEEKSEDDTERARRAQHGNH